MIFLKGILELSDHGARAVIIHFGTNKPGFVGTHAGVQHLVLMAFWKRRVIVGILMRHVKMGDTPAILQSI